MHPHPLILLRKMRTLLLALAAGLLLTAWLSTWITTQLRENAGQELAQRTALASRQIETRLKEQTSALHSLQAALYARPDLSKQTITEILNRQNILQRQPGFVAIGFSRPLTREQLSHPLTDRQASEAVDTIPPDYTIHPDIGQSRLQPIEYLYPLTPSTARYLGLDLLSLQVNRQILNFARDNGIALATAPYRQGKRNESPVEFMLHVPVFVADEEGALPTSRRESRYLGTLSAIYQVQQFIDFLELGQHLPAGKILLYDTGGAIDRSLRQTQTLLYDSDPPTQVDPASWLCHKELVELPGRQWHLQMCAQPGQITGAHQNKIWLIWLVGIGLSLLIGGLMQTQVHAVDLARKMASEMTMTLRRQEAKHRKLAGVAETTSDIIVIRDSEGRIEYANPAAIHRLGKAAHPLNHSSAPLLLSAEVGHPNEPVQAISSHLDMDGVLRHYSVMVVSLSRTDSSADGTVLLARDITQLTENSQSLHQNNTRLQKMLDLAADLVWEQDALGEFTELSGRLASGQGLSLSWLREAGSPAPGHFLTGEGDWQRYRQLFDSHQPFRDFILNVHGEKASWILSLSGSPRFDPDGYFIGYHGIGHDITGTHQAHRQAENHCHKLAALFESISDGIITTDSAGHVEYMNPVAVALTGRELEEARQQPVDHIYQVIDAETRLPLASLHRLILADQGTLQRYRNGILLNNFGLNFNIEEAAASIRDNQGKLLGSVVIFRDHSQWHPLAK